MNRLTTLILTMSISGCATGEIGNIRLESRGIITSAGPGVEVKFYDAKTNELIDTAWVAENENKEPVKP